MKSKRWHHYKNNELIGVMDWDSLPDICHKWWEQAQDYNDKKSHFSNLKKEELVFCYDNLRSLDSFDEYGACQMPYCLGHCDSSEYRELSLDYSNKKLNHYNAFRKKLGLKYDWKKHPWNEWEELTDEQEELYRQEKLPEFADTKEYLALLRKYLNRCRDNIIGDIKMNQAYEEYIIYK